MIKHTDETISALIAKLDTLDPASVEAGALRHEIAGLLIKDSQAVKTSELSMVFGQLMQRRMV